MQCRKLVRGQLVLRFVERQLSVDADAAERNVHTAQLVDHLRNMLRIVRVGENALLFRHDQLRINLAVYRAVHEAVEG